MKYEVAKLRYVKLESGIFILGTVSYSFMRYTTHSYTRIEKVNGFIVVFSHGSFRQVALNT
jgi:hypothetical protein